MRFRKIIIYFLYWKPLGWLLASHPSGNIPFTSQGLRKRGGASKMRVSAAPPSASDTQVQPTLILFPENLRLSPPSTVGGFVIFWARFCAAGNRRVAHADGVSLGGVHAHGMSRRSCDYKES